MMVDVITLYTLYYFYITLYRKYSSIIVTNCQSSPVAQKQINSHEERRDIILVGSMIRKVMEKTGKIKRYAVTLQDTQLKNEEKYPQNIIIIA